jgi:hypothetical protein
MEIKVTGKDVISTLVVIGLDITITKDDKEYELELNVKYEDMPNFGTTDITWDVVNDDKFIMENDEDDELSNEIDDFVQDYILNNIGKL